MLQVKVNNKPEIELPELVAVANRKEKFKEYMVKGTAIRASLGKTWKEAKELLNTNLGKMKIETMDQWNELMAKQIRRQKRNDSWQRNHDRLCELLHVRKLFLDRTMYMLGDHVLDVMMLSDFLGVPEDRSLKDVVRGIGGEEAVKLVEEMI